MTHQQHRARAAVLDAVIAFAKTHPAVTAAARVGSTAEGFRDEHSDIDLAIAIVPGAKPIDFLDAAADFLSGPAHGFSTLLDLPYRDAVYRVFLRADGLQLDLSARPAATFAPTTERFALCFGDSRPPEPKARPDGEAQLREAVLYLRQADVALRRKRVRQAQYFLDHVRERVQVALCLKHEVDPFDGRGFDELPGAVLARTAAGCGYGQDEGSLRRAVGAWARAAVRLLRKSGDEKTVRAYLQALGEQALGEQALGEQA